jgi:hypothetical protein
VPRAKEAEGSETRQRPHAGRFHRPQLDEGKLEYLPTQWTNVSVSGDIGKEVMEFVQGYREINKK